MEYVDDDPAKLAALIEAERMYKTGSRNWDTVRMRARQVYAEDPVDNGIHTEMSESDLLAEFDAAFPTAQSVQAAHTKTNASIPLIESSASAVIPATNRAGMLFAIEQAMHSQDRSTHIAWLANMTADDIVRRPRKRPTTKQQDSEDAREGKTPMQYIEARRAHDASMQTRTVIHMPKKTYTELDTVYKSRSGDAYNPLWPSPSELELGKHYLRYKNTAVSMNLVKSGAGKKWVKDESNRRADERYFPDTTASNLPRVGDE